MERDPADAEQRNSPLMIAAVLALVLAVLGGVAMMGTATRTVAGTALPAASEPGQDAAAGGAPEKPGPKSVYQLGTNPLLVPGAGLGEVTCQLPGIKRTPEALRAFYEAGVRCLDAGWRTALTQVGEPFENTGLKIEIPATSACGTAPSKEDATAYYCGGDRTIYMPRERLLTDAGVIPSAHFALLAHEYGHHVQELSGIMGALEDSERTVGKDSPEDQELGRRLELQANCFAGVFVAAAAGRGSVSKALADKTITEFSYVEDSASHGTRKHQMRWARAGYDGKNTAACNTWTVPPEEVS